MIDIGLIIAAIFVFLGAVFGIARLIIGPTLVDRVVALDYLSIVAIATISLLSIHYHASLLLDVAIVLALLSFLATVAFARYIDRCRNMGAGLEELDD